MRASRLYLSLILPLLMANAPAGMDQGEALAFRHRTAGTFAKQALAPEIAASLAKTAQAHYGAHAPARYGSDRSLVYRAACKPDGAGDRLRVAFYVSGVSDVEAIYEFDGAAIRDAYLISYWD